MLSFARRAEKGGHTSWVLVSKEEPGEGLSTWRVAAAATQVSGMWDGGG